MKIKTATTIIITITSNRQSATIIIMIYIYFTKYVKQIFQSNAEKKKRESSHVCKKNKWRRKKYTRAQQTVVMLPIGASEKGIFAVVGSSFFLCKSNSYTFLQYCFHFICAPLRSFHSFNSQFCFNTLIESVSVQCIWLDLLCYFSD